MAAASIWRPAAPEHGICNRYESNRPEETLLKSQIVVLAAVALFVGCSGDPDAAARHQSVAVETPEPANETFALGSVLTSAGAVPQESAGESFTRGGEVFLSVDVTSASRDQNIDVQWVDAQGRIVRKETRKVPEGSRYAAFSSGRVIASTPGRHRAVIIIDGRRVMEKPFSIL